MSLHDAKNCTSFLEKAEDLNKTAFLAVRRKLKLSIDLLCPTAYNERKVISPTVQNILSGLKKMRRTIF